MLRSFAFLTVTFAGTLSLVQAGDCAAPVTRCCPTISVRPAIACRPIPCNVIRAPIVKPVICCKPAPVCCTVACRPAPTCCAPKPTCCAPQPASCAAPAMPQTPHAEPGPVTPPVEAAPVPVAPKPPVEAEAAK